MVKKKQVRFKSKGKWVVFKAKPSKPGKNKRKISFMAKGKRTTFYVKKKK